MAVTEVRVPTFRRPELLKRALESIVRQSVKDWVCIVFDDCPLASAREVVAAIGDSRFSYRHNFPSLGAIGNIDKCFVNDAIMGGGYACVLEDDNCFLEHHISRQLELISRHQVDVVFSSQYVEEVLTPGKPGVVTTARTLIDMYPEGLHNARALLPALMVSHGFSNGAAFWRLGGRSNFLVGAKTQHPGVQESLRMFGLRDMVYVSHCPSALWRSNNAIESYVTTGNSSRGLTRLLEKARLLAWRREIWSYRFEYVRKYGIDDAKVYARTIAPWQLEDMERSLLRTGKYVELSDRSLAWRVRQMLLGFLFRIYPRDLGAFSAFTRKSRR